MALRLGIIDRPDSRLKRHLKPTPYLGGLAIYIACAAAIIASKLGHVGYLHGILGILTGGTLMFLLGLTDDVRPMRPGIKLILQFLIALIPIYCGVHIKFIENPWGALPLTALWIVGITNALNLLDVMDGLAGGIALIAASFFLVISAQNGRFNDALIAASLAGAAAGFLAYNRPPARIFMGDAGSMFLGYTLASVAIGLGYSQDTNLGVVAPLLVLGVPIFETLFLMAMRMQQGIPIMKGSPDHIALRLRKMGFRTGQVLAILWGAALLLGISAYMVAHLNWERALLISVGVVFAAMLAAIRLASVRMNA